MPHLTPDEILARAKEFQQCADHAVQNSRFNAAALCCYAALFWAARAALAREGFKQSSWSHGELRSTFTHELIRKKSRYSRKYSTWLWDGFTYRNAAQYGLVPPSTKSVRRSVRNATDFVSQVEKEISK